MIRSLRVKLWFWRRFIRYWLLSRANTITLISGMPRSGTTALYNISEALLRSAGKQVERAWVNDLPFRFRVGRYLIIKLHDYDNLLYKAGSHIIHSVRDIREIAASQKVRDGVEPTLEGLEKVLIWDKQWKEKAHVLFDYKEFQDMESVVGKLANQLGVKDYDAGAILQQVDQERSNSPQKGLWHNNHLTGKGQDWESVLSKELIQKLEDIRAR